MFLQKFELLIWLHGSVLEKAERVANCVDPDQMVQNVASDLGLHCLLRYVE